MTISSNLSTVTRNGNGVATSFSFPFKVWDTSQLDVYITDPNGVTTQTSNFTAALSGSGGNVVYPAAGGVVLPTGWTITIIRSMPFTQNVDLVNGQAFYPDVIEQALDQLTATCQQLDEGLSRSVKVDPGQTDPAALLTQIQAAVTNSGNSATAAASSASAAADSEVAAAASAAAAQAAAATLSPATTTSRGIARVATLADFGSGTTENGPACLAADGDYHLPVQWIPGLFVGDMRLLPFRAADLATHCPGWHFCNGDQYSLTSDVGVALNGLPESFKTDWGIVVTGDNISVPNLFYSDGRGLFLRAGASPGVIVNDAIRNMTGDLAFFCGGSMYNYTGVFSTSYSSTWTRDASAHAYTTNGIARFNAASVVPTADENRPVHVTFTPAIFLDV